MSSVLKCNRCLTVDRMQSAVKRTEKRIKELKWKYGDSQEVLYLESSLKAYINDLAEERKKPCKCVVIFKDSFPYGNTGVKTERRGGN